MVKSRNRPFLKRLYAWHAWAGFQLAIIMFTILVTGTVATISNEIDWLIFEEMRTFNGSDERAIGARDWVEIYQAAYEDIAVYKDGRYVQTLMAMGHDNFTYRARITVPGQKSYFLHIDQWTKQVTGHVPTLTVQRVFRDFHRYLFMPAFPGIVIVCAFSFVLALSFYTGLKTTRNWRVALLRLRVRHGARIFLSDLHKVVGLWGAWFLLVIVVTGFWYLFEFGVHASGGSLAEVPSKISRTIQHESELGINPKQFELAFARASSELDWTITTVHMPFSATGAIRFQGRGDNPMLRERAYIVDIHPLTLATIKSVSPENSSVGQYLNEYADPLHFGYFGGLWTKFIWFIFGLGLTGLSVTGVLMTWRRTRTKALTRQQVSTLPILALSIVAFAFWLQYFL